MKVKTLSLIAAGAATALVGTAQADFLGTELELWATPEINGVQYESYRVWATFSAPAQLLGTFGDVGIESFVNHVDGSFNQLAGDAFFKQSTAYGQQQLFAPNQFQMNANPNWEFDTYAALGQFSENGGQIANAGGNFDITPGLSSAGLGFFGGNWEITGGEGWFSTNPTLSELQAVQGDDGIYRAGLFQITIEAGQFFEGNIGVGSSIGNFHDGIGAGGLGGLAGLDGPSTYFTNVPAPGALALLGLAGLAGARRRRA